GRPHHTSRRAPRLADMVSVAGGEALGRAAEALRASVGERVRPGEPLGSRTTYRVGGPAAWWFEVEDEDDLRAVHDALHVAAAPVPVLVVGKGSNLLVADAGFPGLVLAPGAAMTWVTVDGAVVRAGGATGYPVVARRSAAAGLRGLEWAVGVPGSVGGALRMNAGGHGSDTAAVLARYRVFDLATGAGRDCAADEFRASYRRSSVEAADVVVWAEFALEPGDADAAQRALSEVVRWRRAHQPGGSNAGSVFTNPAEGPAGLLIEQAGLKGRRLGTAEVSPKHANFIQADEGGSADDVRRLIDLVRDTVAERTGVTLVPELRMVGFPDTELPFVESAGAFGDERTSSSGGGRG
ncbi:MAG TPA: UDP-N-acetylmuramate dehydrogenase, partial [Acidimicrobiales bacterium]|nr:UDP-N-acetylmuramate dehydrogenase [Acidimicrobiales bacterium]